MFQRERLELQIVLWEAKERLDQDGRALTPAHMLALVSLAKQYGDPQLIAYFESNLQRRAERVFNATVR